MSFSSITQLGLEYLPTPVKTFPPYLLSHLQTHLDLPVKSATSLTSVLSAVAKDPTKHLILPLFFNHVRAPTAAWWWYGVWQFIKDYYVNAEDPAWTVLPFLIGNMVLSYLVGLATGNVSQIDRQWTMLPVIYAFHFALYPLYAATPAAAAYAHNTPRLLLMAGLQIIWGVRLTWHTSKRGLYNFFDEDYRWAIWRKMVPRWFFELFHIGFIILFQCILLLMLSLPVHMSLVLPRSEAEPAFSTADVILTSLTSFILIIQFTADHQHQAYQTYKRAYLELEKAHGSSSNKTAKSIVDDSVIPEDVRVWKSILGLEQIVWKPEDARRGFCTRGLWSWSRHPNFACEQTFWILQALFAVFAGNPSSATKSRMLLPNPLIAPLTLSMLFVASTQFTEHITAGKYPVYRAYQTIVGEFTPQASFFKGIGLRLLGRRKEVATPVFGGRAKQE